jgi:phosphoribosylaminoimidazolecarboxamide formyltransferase/IMP cyclohydrolase
MHLHDRSRGLPCASLQPEILNGRVKTLHPKIHGGILSVRGNAEHDKDLADNGFGHIDMVVVNLYPFAEAVAKGGSFAQCMENVDIGGPTMLRASAKSNQAVICVSNPAVHYAKLMKFMAENDGCTSTELRVEFAKDAFAHSAEYDAAISKYMHDQAAAKAAEAAGAASGADKVVVVPEFCTRAYRREFPLKYGCNPHQLPAALTTVDGDKLPFTVLNGKPGYINLLDAANAWQLVRELKQGLGMAAAASFKHVSPAGCAVATPLTDLERVAYEIPADRVLTPCALAYVRARNADPMSSFGDFAAVSEVVDVATAKVLKFCVCDGIVAPGFEPEALEILAKKKKGKFICLEADMAYDGPDVEFREVFGMGFMQRRNHIALTRDHLSGPVGSAGKAGAEGKAGEEGGASAVLPDSVQRDMVLSSIALKYTQSNSVGYAMNGQMVGVGAGQQSRVDCTKLAGRKVKVWALRQHPKVTSLPFKEGVKKQARINARVRYIEGDITEVEHKTWVQQFTEAPEPLTDAEKDAFMKDFEGVTLASDAFFPFRDSIDHASKYGVSYIVQPGGSVNDASVTEAADEYGMIMSHTGVRLFHH